VGIFGPSPISGAMLGEGIAGIISLFPLILYLSFQNSDSTDSTGIIFCIFAASISLLGFIMQLLLRCHPLSRQKMAAFYTARNYTYLKDKMNEKMEYTQSTMKNYIKKMWELIKIQFKYGFAVGHSFFWTLLVYPVCFSFFFFSSFLFFFFLFIF
jgi:hypothetical protein